MTYTQIPLQESVEEARDQVSPGGFRVRTRLPMGSTRHRV